MSIREPSGPAKIPLSDNARVVLERRYLAKDAEGHPLETPEQMFARVARTIPKSELLYKPLEDFDAAAHWEERFYGLMARLEFLPNSPTLMKAGRDLQQLSGSFLAPAP